MDLFDDLPEPKQRSGEPVEPTGGQSEGAQGEPTGVAVTAPLPTTEEEGEQEESREKRKRDDTESRGGDEEEEEEEKRGKMKKVCKEGLPVLTGYVAARRGERDEMQDAHVLLPDLSVCLSSPPPHVSRLSYFGVFDGHGGARASRFAAENLHVNLAKKFPNGDSENLEKLMRRSLMEAFRLTDEEFLRKASSQRPVWKDGSTVTCVLQLDDLLLVANLGDSRAVLCRMDSAAGGTCAVLSLTKEHNPTIYDERMRIQRAGGTVRDGRVLGVLEVSRSIGDGQFKRCGVIATPDVRHCRLSANDRFVLLACDGLFKVFSADEAVRFVLAVLQEGVMEQVKKEEEELRFEAACQQLASEAVKRGCADNVTVILLSIGY